MDTIATRVRRALTASGMHQKDLARAVDMTPDALSRALNGNRGFAALELAELARVLEADLVYLITGEQESTRLRLAARHTYDPVTGRRDVKGLDADQAVLSDVQLAYEQAGDAPVSELSCADVSSLRAALGPEFVRYFIIHLERVGVDVVRMAELSTAYGFRIGSRPVIAIPETGNWFRENWDLAHEAAHL